MDQSIIENALRGIELHIPNGSTVVVGMSGGVDSSVTAALLKELGYDVIGLLMKNWEEDGTCCIEEDAQDVARVATMLQIPFYTVQFAKEYWEQVFEKFLADLKSGLTPNPDILCNREVKFGHLLEKALSMGASALATGHYAANSIFDNTHRLQLARDNTKDQTYFLYTATQETLSHSLFPLAHLHKSEVRKIAQTLNLPVAEKKDSTGVCFIGERNFRHFLEPYLGLSPGPMVTVDGKKIGDHIGLGYYTIGQRKGLKIGGEGAAWFVVAKNPETNTLTIAQGTDHPALFAHSLIAHQSHWISGETPSFPFFCTAKIRYRQEDSPCEVIMTKTGELYVRFEKKQRAITPGQSIVFYDGASCLGGAVIQRERRIEEIS
jgi:tRNA-specific 2-thiouridylase